MTESDAQEWIAAAFGMSAFAIMQQLVVLVTAEAQRQNLIAESTIKHIWDRHIVDSAQLLSFVPTYSAAGTRWIDVGSGAGFPGLVVAALSQFDVVLVEPRKRRAAFLEDALCALQLSRRSSVICGKAKSVTLSADVISARAVANLDTVFGWMQPAATLGTRWILPKGRHALAEVEIAKKLWHGTFHVEQSLTDQNSLIVVASGVKRR